MQTYATFTSYSPNPFTTCSHTCYRCVVKEVAFTADDDGKLPHHLYIAHNLSLLKQNNYDVYVLRIIHLAFSVIHAVKSFSFPFERVFKDQNKNWLQGLIRELPQNGILLLTSELWCYLVSFLTFSSVFASVQPSLATCTCRGSLRSGTVTPSLWLTFLYDRWHELRGTRCFSPYDSNDSHDMI